MSVNLPNAPGTERGFRRFQAMSGTGWQVSSKLAYAGQACGDRAVNALPPALAAGREDDINLKGASIMGKYLLGWILGVPVVVLIIIYLIFN